MTIYSENAFRILGLSVTASNRDIARRVEELQTFIVIGQVPNYNTDLLWISKFDRNEETIKKALQVLEHPKTRLLHLLSWFWVLDDYDNQAIDALDKKLVDKALFLWNAAAQQEKNIYYVKNLATLELILSIQGSDSDYNHLINGIKLWAEFASSEHLPHIINNFSLNKSTKINESEIINTIGKVLNLSAKRFFDKCVKGNQIDKIGHFFNTLKESKMPPKLLDFIKEEYVRLLSEKIDSLCNKLSKEDNDFEQLYSETITFFEAVIPYYEQIKQTGDLYIIESYGDKIGGLILDRAIYYGNKTTQWQKSKNLFEMAETTIVGQFLKDRFEKNLEITTKNIQQEKVFGKIKTIESAPNWGNSFYGIGTALYGHANYDTISNSYEVTKYFTVLAIPIIPLARYRVIKLGDNYYSFLGKVPFRIFDKIHLLLGIFAIFFVCFLVIINSEKRSSNYSSKTYDNPSTSYNRNKNYIDSKPQEIKALGAIIDNARLRLSTMKSELHSLEGTLKRYENQLQLLENEIKDAESKARTGEYVNEYAYYNNIEKYNNLVNQYNSTLANYKASYAKYKSLFDTTNENISKYNRLIRAK